MRGRASRWTACALAAAMLLGSAEVRAAAPSPVGLWRTEGGDGVIRLEPCDNGVCGTIAGTDNPAQCGLTIMNLAAGEDGTWSGHVTDPSNGTVWRVRVRLDERDRLLLRGYVILPLLGATQVWTRYTGRLTPDCRMV